MSIVTITHAAFSGGTAIAENVASKLGYRSIDREVLLEASKRYGIPEAKYSEVLETQGKWWERWVESLRLYRITLQAAMCEVAQEGNMVYHGRVGQELFPGVGHVLKVLVIAPLEHRVEVAKKQRSFDDQAARNYIRELDRVRSRRVRALFNTDWQDPVIYDLVINSSRLSSETAAHLIASAAQSREYQATVESEKSLQDLTMTSRVQAALITANKTRNVILTVRSDSGKVHISGILADTELEKEVVRIAKEIPGVAEVVTDIEPPPIEYMHP